MNGIRAAFVAVGGAVLALATLSVFGAETASVLPVDQAVALLGNGYFLVAVFAVLAVIVALTVLLGRGLAGIDQATLPAHEDVERAPLAGEAFTDFIESAGIRAWVFENRAHDVRADLREAAIVTEMRVENCSRSEAESRINRGAWTNDRTAAVFLAERHDPDLAARVEAAIRGESPFQRAAARTAETIAARDEGYR